MQKENKIEKTFDQIIQNGFNIDTAPFHEKVVILITTAQGIIDNGGFQYFFENKFENNTNPNEFVKAFEAIDAHESANAIKKAIEMNEIHENNNYDNLDVILFKESEANYKKLEKYINNEFA